MTPGLYHDFYLVSLQEFSHNEYAKGYKRKDGVAIHDYNLHYLSSSLRWISTYNPARKESYKGLCWYGPTVIRLEGAETARRVFQAWADLFKNGPEILQLTERYVFDAEHPDGYYDILNIPRDEFVSQLSTLASYAQKITDTDGQYFILHLGV